MSKSFTGTTIGYGKLLPQGSGIADGALFYKTEHDPGNDWYPPGLYIYSFRQDLPPFIRNPSTGDLEATPVGDQVGFGWTAASTLADYVSKSGDEMSGRLVVNAGIRAAQGAPSASDASNTGYSFGDDGDSGLFASGSGVGSTGISIYLNSIERFKVDASGNAYLGSNKIWHEGNDGVGSTLDAAYLGGQSPSYYRDLGQSIGSLPLTSTSGVLPVSRGGTNVTAVTAGGVVYAASASQLATTGAGVAGQVITSNGSQAAWANTSTIVGIGSALKLTNPRSISLAGAVTGSTNFDGSGNVTITTSVGSIPYSSITGAPASFYTFTTGAASPTPPTFPASSLSGFDSYNTTDIGQYHVGVTVMGTSSGGARGLQLAANWNAEEVTPSGLKFRVNDDTGTLSAWGPWSTIWNEGNLNPANYVLKSGDVMSGSLTVQDDVNVQNDLTVVSGSIFLSGGSSSVNAPTGNFSSVAISGSTNAVNQNSGALRVPNGGASVGLDLWVGGTMNCVGNIIAYASDARLKKNVKVIPNALQKVQALGGYEYDWDLEKTNDVKFYPENEHEHGLLAQEVRKVMPDAVSPAPFNPAYFTVKYDRLVALLVAAMNEQQEQINELKAQLASK